MEWSVNGSLFQKGSFLRYIPGFLLIEQRARRLSWINLSHHEDHIPPHYLLTLDGLTCEGTFFGLTIGTRIT
jgi:hypothetical protein